jgi:hypothetical protein
MADLVDETAQGIRARMSELAPVVAEYKRLQAAYAALEGSGADAADGRSEPAPSRGPGWPVEIGGVRGRGRRVRARHGVRTRRRCLT